MTRVKERWGGKRVGGKRGRGHPTFIFVIPPYTYQIVEGPPYASPLPPHVDAFRELLVPDAYEKPLLVLSVWRSLLPGLAQLWYRWKVTWRDLWPLKLLQFLRVDLDHGDKSKVAEDLLDCESCCLGNGGSIAADLKDIALSYPTHDEQIRFLLCPWSLRLISTWSLALSSSIADLECGNAKIKKTTTSGRPQECRDSCIQYRAVGGGGQFLPSNGHSTRESVQDHTRIVVWKRWRKRETEQTEIISLYDEFRKEYYESRRQLEDIPSRISTPEAAFDMSDAYRSFKDSRQHTYTAAITDRQPDVQQQESPLVPLEPSGTRALVPCGNMKAIRCYKLECAPGGKQLSIRDPVLSASTP